MDNIPAHGTVDIEAKPKANTGIFKGIKVVISSLLFIVYLISKCTSSDTPTNFFSDEEIESVNRLAKIAVLTKYNTINEDTPYLVHVSKICDISTDWYCEEYGAYLSNEDYTNLVENDLECTIVSSDYEGFIEYEDYDKVMIYHVIYKIFTDNNQDGQDFDKAVIMANESGWKLLNVVNYDELIDTDKTEDE